MAAASAREIINYHAKRWTIEPGFRDTKDLRFGMGMDGLRISDPQRRDRLLLLGPPEKASARAAISSPTPPSVAPIRSSTRAACALRQSQSRTLLLLGSTQVYPSRKPIPPNPA